MPFSNLLTKHVYRILYQNKRHGLQVYNRVKVLNKAKRCNPPNNMGQCLMYLEKLKVNISSIKINSLLIGPRLRYVLLINIRIYTKRTSKIP